MLVSQANQGDSISDPHTYTIKLAVSLLTAAIFFFLYALQGTNLKPGQA
jgi:hypothetical protein